MRFFPFHSTSINPSPTNSLVARLRVQCGILVTSEDSTTSPLTYWRLNSSAKMIKANWWALAAGVLQHLKPPPLGPESTVL